MLGPTAIAGILAVALGALLAWPGGTEPILHNDSSDYLDLDSPRLPGYGVIGWMFGPTAALVWFQTLASLAAWSWLGATIGGRPGIAVATLFAISAPIHQWNLMVLSESFTLTVLAALLATTVRLARNWNGGNLVAFGLTAIWFASIKTTNALVLVPLALAFWTGRHGRWKTAGLIGFAIVLAAVAMRQFHRNGNGLRLVSLNNVITARILPDTAARTWFEQHGMPIDDALRAQSGKLWSFQGGLEQASPRYAEWLADPAAGCYARYLATHPGAIITAIAAIDDNAANPMIPGYLKDRTLPAGPRLLRPLHRATALPLWLWLALLATQLALVIRARNRSPQRLLPAATGLAALGLGALMYLGDAGEVPRHLLVSSTLYRVAAALAAIEVARRAFARVTDRTRLRDRRSC